MMDIAVASFKNMRLQRLGSILSWALKLQKQQSLCPEIRNTPEASACIHVPSFQPVRDCRLK